MIRLPGFLMISASLSASAANSLVWAWTRTVWIASIITDLQGAGETTALIAARERNPGKWSEAGGLLNESLNIYAEMKANDRFYGADSRKVADLNAFIEKHKRELTR